MIAFLEIKAAGEGYYMKLSDEKMADKRKEFSGKGKRQLKYPRQEKK